MLLITEETQVINNYPFPHDVDNISSWNVHDVQTSVVHNISLVYICQYIFFVTTELSCRQSRVPQLAHHVPLRQSRPYEPRSCVHFRLSHRVDSFLRWSALKVSAWPTVFKMFMFWGRSAEEMNMCPTRFVVDATENSKEGGVAAEWSSSQTCLWFCTLPDTNAHIPVRTSVQHVGPNAFSGKKWKKPPRRSGLGMDMYKLCAEFQGESLRICLDIIFLRGKHVYYYQVACDYLGSI